jgi:GAF domain
MSENGFRAAVAAGVIGAEDAYRSLLRSIVEVARAIFSAQRSSIFLLDEETDELVFEALAGEEEQGLIGTRIPSSTGIAGWTLVTRQPLVIENLEEDPRHSREVAEKTGYVPKGIMSVPLLVEERALGVLQVLDRPARSLRAGSPRAGGPRRPAWRPRSQCAPFAAAQHCRVQPTRRRRSHKSSIVPLKTQANLRFSPA